MRPSALLVLALTALAIAGVAGCRDESARLEEHFTRAEEFREQELLQEAILEYKNVVQIDPNHAAAHFGLARAYIANDQIGNAAWELRETLRLDPTNIEARLRMAELSGLWGEYDEALLHADAILAAGGSDGDIEFRLPAQLVRARVLDLQRKPVEALDAYEKAVELAPDATEPVMMLANYHRRRGNDEQAEPLYRKLVDRSPSYVSYAALGSFLSRDRTRDDETIEAYELAIENADEEQRTLGFRTLASFYYSRRRYEEAEATLLKALEERPEELELIYFVARFYLSRGDQEKADRMIERATRAKPTEVGPYLILSRYRFQTGDTEAALVALDLALEVEPDNDLVLLERAERIVDLGVKKGPRERIQEARSVIEQVLAKDAASSEALGLKGKLDLLEGRTEEAIRTLRQAADLRPDWPPLQFLLGSALFFEGNFLAAKDELERALELDASLLEARFILVRAYAAMGRHKLAVEEGKRVLIERPYDRNILMLVAQSLAAEREIDQAITVLDRIANSQEDPRTLFIYGLLFAAKGEPERARGFFERADVAGPHHPEVLRKLLELDRREGRLAESIARIDDALESKPDDAALVHLSGLAARMDGRTDDAEALLRRAIELDPANPMPYTSLARLLQGSGRAEEAIATYEEALEERPDLASIHFILATLHEYQGNVDTAIEHYESTIRLDPDLAAAKNDLANLLAEQRRDLERALTLAQEARAAMPEHPQTADTLGWVLYKMGRTSAAVDFLQEAEAQAANDPEIGLIRHHLALAYEANGQPRRARETIDRALADLKALQASAPSPDEPEPEWADDMRKQRSGLRRPLVAPQRAKRSDRL